MSLDIFTGISQVLLSGATAGVQTYATLETLDLAKEQAEMQMQLTQEKAALEQQFTENNLALLDIQKSGIEQMQGIDIDVAQAQAEMAIDEMQRTGEISALEAEVEKKRIALELQKLDFAQQLAEQEYMNQMRMIEATPEINNTLELLRDGYSDQVTLTTKYNEAEYGSVGGSRAGSYFEGEAAGSGPVFEENNSISNIVGAAAIGVSIWFLMRK